MFSLYSALCINLALNYFARGEGSCDECMGGYIYGEGGGGGARRGACLSEANVLILNQ